jgi:hypothetical protein
MSKPIVLTACILAPSESWSPQQQPPLWHSRAGGGAVHSITFGPTHHAKRGTGDCSARQTFALQIGTGVRAAFYQKLLGKNLARMKEYFRWDLVETKMLAYIERRLKEVALSVTEAEIMDAVIPSGHPELRERPAYRFDLERLRRRHVINAVPDQAGRLHYYIGDYPSAALLKSPEA